MGKTRIINRLPDFIATVQAKAVHGITQALILGQSEASVMTPIDTSTLLNSQYKKVEVSATRVVGTAGYDTEYASAVHDPNHKQTFRRASAEKSFLSKGFENAEPSIRAAIAASIKV